MEIPLLKDVVIIFGLSIGVLLLCHRLRVPYIVGFLITGIVAGPQGFRLVDATEEVHTLAEVGIVMLLFTVGLEFSIKKILAHKRYFLIAGPIQVAMTVLGGFLAGQLLGRPANESLFLGFLISLSSTAIVMRVLQERAETNSPQGRLTLGILIFQDVVVVLMMLATPMLAGEGQDIDTSLFLLLGQGILILVVTFYSAIQLVPTLLYYVAKTRSRELFLLTILVICFGVAWITSTIGLSLALGAFLAGLVISESEYGVQAIGDVVPFQDIFTSFFFVSIGMLLDVEFFLDEAVPIVLLTLGIFLFKGAVVSATALIMGLPVRTAVLSGTALSQVGEFSFVLAMTGITYNIGTEYLHQLFIAVAVLSMGFTPSLIALSPKAASWALQLPLPPKLVSGTELKEEKTEFIKKDHVIIVGYGFSGRNLSRSTREAEVPYLVIDMNPETVREEKLKGEPIYFGDATRDRVLEHANIKEAKVVAVLVNDPIAALRIVEHARKMNPSIYIITRTRYLEEISALFQLGADDVIPDELGSSIEIFSRVLTKYEVPSDHIEQLVQVLKVEGYEMLRPRYSDVTLFSDLREYLSEVGVKSFTVRENSYVADKSLIETQLRKKHGLTVLVIKRETDTIYSIEPETILIPGDTVVVIGTKESLATAEKLFMQP